MIQKIIHRVWISEELPDPNTAIGRCFYSQEMLKDFGYEIITHNAKNFDFSISRYLLQAYSLKQWAFVTDYIRLWALYNYGGIYMDADVEVMNKFDELLNARYFFGAVYDTCTDREIDHGKNFPRPTGLIDNVGWLLDGGVFGAEKHSHIVKLWLDHYNSINFIDDNFRIHNNWQHNKYEQDFFEFKVSKVISDNKYKKFGWYEDIDEYVKAVNNSDITKDIHILNTEFLGDFNYKNHINENCICIHQHLGSWMGTSISDFRFLTKYEKEEYYRRYLENKKTIPPKRTYFLTKNPHIVKDLFDIHNHNILSNLYEVDEHSKNGIVINFDEVDNVSLLKHKLKNLPSYNCYMDKNYDIHPIENIDSINVVDNLLTKFSQKKELLK